MFALGPAWNTEREWRRLIFQFSSATGECIPVLLGKKQQILSIENKLK